MTADPVRFIVQEVFSIPGRPETYVAGKIESGVIQAGMEASIPVDGGLFWNVAVKSVERVRSVDHRSDVALAFDTSEEEAQSWFRGLCAEGDILVLNPVKIANQSTDPVL